VNQCPWFHCNWSFLIQHISEQAVPGLHFLLLLLQIVKIVGTNGKLISNEQLRLIYILLQGHLEGKEVDGVTQVQQPGEAPHGCQSNVLAMGTFTKFPVIIFLALSEIKKFTQRAFPVVV
jgi:hypothetical protein